jgi:3-methyladenine DNA glycosylase/8-oxoguanine DNA glycosylase
MIGFAELGIDESYDFQRSTFRFRTFGDDLASRWIDGGLHRVLHSGLAVRIEATGVTAYGEVTDDDRIELAHGLGARFDVPGLIAAFPDVAARAPGFRPPLLFDPFEMLVTSVTAQQISLKVAAVMRRGLVERFGRRVEHDGRTWWRFPAADDIRGGDLTGLKLSGAKIRAISSLVDASDELVRAELDTLPDEAVIARLSTLHGIGRWTAEWFLARCLGRPNVVAAGDLGVRKAVAAWFSEDPIWPEPRVREACAAFGIHTNLAVHYLLAQGG